MDKKKHGSHGGAHHTEEPVAEAAAPAPEGAPAAGVDRVEELEQALAAKEAEAVANWDKFVRERADLENFRKRTQREKEELLKYGNESIIMEILPVVDNMERALDHASDESASAVIEGVRMTLGMLQATLKKFGVTAVEAGKGTTFDPAVHQAMCQVDNADLPANSVVEIFQKGYLLNERLIRPAMVSVSK